MNIACSICLESFSLTCNIYTTPCGHVFHYECILKWLESGNPHCSQCRKNCVTNQISKLFFSETDLALQENSISGFSAQLITQLKTDNLKLQQEVHRLKARELEEDKKCVELNNEKSNLSIMYHQSRSQCGGMERVLKKQREDLNDKDQKIKKFENAIDNLKFGDNNNLGIPTKFFRKSLLEQFSRNHLQDQLHDAVVKSNVEDCKVILTQLDEKIGDTYTEDTALHNAALFGVPKTFKLILDLAENKNPRNIIGKTPLHLAAEWGHAEICQMILPLVDEKNPEDHWKSTPLHYAAKWGHLKICEMILAEVSNKNPINNLDETVLSVAIQAGNDAICRLIESALMENQIRNKSVKTKRKKVGMPA